MMSEKYTNRGSTVYENDEELSTIDVVDLLNEQQATIQSLKEENEKLIQNKCIPCELVSLQVREIDKLKEENEQLRQFITKGRRLSVKELMENTNENELLKKKIMELEKENKELQTELDSFRPVIFHTIQRGTITLYTNTNL